MRYRPAAELANNASTGDLLHRLEALESAGLASSKPAAQSAFGTIDRPHMVLSGLIEAYFSISSDRMLGKAPDQIRKFKLPKERAVRNLISVVGDKDISELSREDALAFRDWWLIRVREEGLNIATANKNIGHLNGMLNDIDDLHRLNLGRVFDRMRLKGERTNQAPSFSTRWMQECS